MKSRRNIVILLEQKTFDSISLDEYRKERLQDDILDNKYYLQFISSIFGNHTPFAIIKQRYFYEK